MNIEWYNKYNASKINLLSSIQKKFDPMSKPTQRRLSYLSLNCTRRLFHQHSNYLTIYKTILLFSNLILYLLHTFHSDYFGEISRKHVERRKKESRSAEMRVMGYSV